jgi:excinuclease ABC subunit C
LIDEQTYNDEIAQARDILKGHLSLIENHFKSEMKRASEAMEFELAARYKHKIDYLDKFQTKTMVVSNKLTDIDVVTITSSKEEAYINYMMVKEGAVVFSTNLEVKKKLEETDDDILSMATAELRTQHNSINKIIYTNVPILVSGDDIENTVPQIGDKKKLVSLSLTNALHIKTKKEIERGERKLKQNETLVIMQRDLRLPTIPDIIECFDNSNLQGTNPVASMVRFVNGKPDKAGYRHFNIKTVIGPDDFASMKEIVGRRYKRIQEENGMFPHLIIVDGGKGQLSSACEALKELGIYGQIPIVGIAKKLEEIYYPEDPIPLHISKKSPALLLIQRVRDEAHRFAITFHRLKRSKSTIKTEMEDIKGIGKKTADLLLQKYRSFKKVQEAPREELIELIGEKKTDLILNKRSENLTN